MPIQIIQQRPRFFLAVEGQSEQSFIAWLQRLANQASLHVHLDAVLLGGGGFKSMVNNALQQLKKRRITGGSYKAHFLLVDGDRADNNDWPIEKLRNEANKHKITVCVQNPNHEGLLLRMIPGMERKISSPKSSVTQLKKYWPSYEKPMNANDLTNRFSKEDLLRVARVDADLNLLLEKIGLFL